MSIVKLKVLFSKDRYIALAYKVIGAFLAFIVQFVLVKLYGAESFGEYSYFLSAAYTIVIFSLFGMTDSTIKYVSKSIAQNDAERGYFSRFAVKFLICMGILSSLLAVTFIALVEVNSVPSPLMLLLFVPLWVLFDFNISILRGRGLGVYSILVNQLVRPVIFLTLAVVYYFTFFDKNSENLILFYGVTLAVIAIATIIYNKSIFTLHACNKTKEGSPKQWLNYSKSMFGVSISNEIIKRSDILILGLFVKFELVALYVVIQSLANLIAFPLQSLNSFGASKISEYWEKGQKEELHNFLNVNSRFVFIISGLLYLCLCVFGVWLLGLYDESFYIGYWVLLVYAFAQLINALSGPVGYVMSMTGNQKVASNVFILGAVINVILNALLIPHYQLMGAAIATVLSMAFWNITLVYYSRKKVGVATCFLIGRFK